MTIPVNILLTDDESGLRTAMARALARSGHNVEVASNGLDALERIEAATRGGRPFELLITDVNMPGMRGDRLVAKLRAEGSELEILVISGFGDKSLLVDLMRLGVENYMDKPFSASEFLGKVANVCDSIARKKNEADRSKDLESQVALLLTDVVRFRRGLEEMKTQLGHAVRSYQSLVNLPQ